MQIEIILLIIIGYFKTSSVWSELFVHIILFITVLNVDLAGMHFDLNYPDDSYLT